MARLPVSHNAALSQLRSRRRPFKLSHFLVTRLPGVYAIWYGHRCLYVGMAAGQTIGTRLSQHRALAHLPDLRDWIEVKNGVLQFTTCELSQPTTQDRSRTRGIAELEARMISALNPELNVRRPRPRYG